MDVRVLSFLFAFLMLALTRYNRVDPARLAQKSESLRANAVAARDAEFETAKTEFGLAGDVHAASSPAPIPTETPRAAFSTLPAAPARPRTLSEVISARHAAVFDLQTGEALYSKGSDGPVMIASISKLMTAIVAYELFPPTSTIEFRVEDLAGFSHHSELGTGDRMGFKEAMALMMIQSDNSVARALARTYGYDAFLSKMNEKARALNMKGTHFEDPTGYAANRASTRDLLRMAQYILSERPEIFAITRIPSRTISTLEGKRLVLKNTNEFAGALAGFVGGKTGFTDEAGGCLLTVVVDDGRTYMAVVLGSSDRFGDTKRLIEGGTIL